MAQRKKNLDFEDKINRLEHLVESLEKGELSLEQAMQAFEEGIKITRECQQALSEAEQRVNKLTENNRGELSSTPFSVDEAD